MSTETVLFGESLRAEVTRWLEEVGKTDRDRFLKLLKLSVAPKIRLSDALDQLFPGEDTQTALANLTRLRKRLNDAADGDQKAKPDLGLRFHVDTKKKSPPSERTVWFTGPDAAVLRATRFSEQVTADIAGRPFVPSKGIATTGSAMAERKRVVRFFVSYARKYKDLTDGLIDELKSQFGCSSRYEVELWMDQDTCIGERWHERIQTAIQASNFGLLIISPEFLNREYIREHELPHYLGDSPPGKPIIPVGLIKVDFEHQDLLGLAEHQIFRKAGKNNEARFYEEMQGTTKKREFAHQLFLAIQKRLDAYFSQQTDFDPNLSPSAPLPLGGQSKAERRSFSPQRSREAETEDPRLLSPEDALRLMRTPEETRHFQRTRGFAHHLSEREALDPAKAPLGEARDALDELEAWAVRTEGSSFFALLGEVGIGKTTTLKQFTRLLIDKRGREPGQYPLPIYIDLRDYVGDRPGAVPTIEELLTSVIQRSWRVTDRTVTAADLLRLVREEGALIIFDGLDEKIVHLTQDRARDFIRTLWSALPPRSGTILVPEAQNSGKLLLSCRSHYFRDVWSQNAMLTGEDREGIDRSQYPVFCLLPFDERQIRDYLVSFLGDAKRGSDPFDLIASIHNLRDLAERPYLLSLISGRLGELEALKMRGETVNAARLYDLVVRSWLSRDDGKHQLGAAHKRRLMEALAAALWRSGEKQWDVDRLEDWLDDFLHQNPALAAAYANKDRSLLKEDLRTATFVLRPDTEDKSFRFAHTSLQEYFLACHLARTLKEKADAAWDMPIASLETLDFLGQILALEPQTASILSLERLLGSDCLPAATMAFQYWLQAIQHGHPEPQPKHVNLAGANFDEQTLKGHSKDRPLNLRGANLRGVQLNRARVEFVDLSEADLTGLEARQALFRKVRASKAKVINADLAGLQWRGGSLDLVEIAATYLEVAELHDVSLGSMATPRVVQGMCRPRADTGHHSFIHDCAWNPRGTAIVSASSDKTLKVWDAATGRELLTFEGHSTWVSSCAWSPNGGQILSGSGDKTLKVWDVATGNEVQSFIGHKGAVSSCAWSPDGSQVLSGAFDNTLRIWNVATGKEILSIKHGGSVRCCAWSSEGSRVLSGAFDNTLKVWDAVSGKELLSLVGHLASVSCCAWSPDNSRLLSGSGDKTLKVWDAATGKEVWSFSGHSAEVGGCAWSPDSRRILSRSYDKTLKVWDTATGKEVHSLAGSANWVGGCAWSPDGGRVLSGTDEQTLKVWDASTWKQLLSLVGHGAWISSCAWSSDGTQVLSGSYDKTLKVWDVANGKEVLCLSRHADRVTCCAWSLGSSRVLSGSGDKTLKIWDAETGKELLSLPVNVHWVSCCAWSPDGQRALSGADDKTLKVWDAATGIELLSLVGHANWISSCTWSPDSSRVLSGSYDKTLKVWDALTGKELLSLAGHSAEVRCCAWSLDGSRLLSGSGDKTLKVWDPITGKELCNLVGHLASVSCCAWSPDGSRVLSGSSDKTRRSAMLDG
jgi:WD40 repeat protein/uncharacterized protein YjbI with pentapeptide repeats